MNKYLLSLSLLGLTFGADAIKVSVTDSSSAAPTSLSSSSSSSESQVAPFSCGRCVESRISADGKVNKWAVYWIEKNHASLCIEGERKGQCVVYSVPNYAESSAVEARTVFLELRRLNDIDCKFPEDTTAGHYGMCLAMRALEEIALAAVATEVKERRGKLVNIENGVIGRSASLVLIPR